VNYFTASNGIVVSPQPQGGVYIRDDCRADSDRAQALREFFQAEADERLGRWRWPENPDYVVYRREAYPPVNARRVRVILEPTGDFVDTVEGSKIDGPFKDAARAYFDAHPEPKPWHDAEPGDVFLVTWPGSEREEAVIVPGGWPEAWECVTSARRIWPVVSA